MRRNLNIATILFGSFLTAIFTMATTASAKFSATAKSVTGRVQQKKVFSSKWETVEPGTVLNQDGLLRVEPNSKISLSLSGNNLFNSDEDSFWTLIIDKPITLRVRPESLRKLELSKRSSSTIHFTHSSATTKDLTVKQSIFRHIEDAWNYMLPDSPPLERILKLDSKQVPGLEDTAITRAAKSFKIVTPTQKTFLITSTFPYEVNVTWESARETEPEYIVRLWKEKSTKATAIDTTKDTSSRLRLANPGTYYLRIETRDGLWVSNIRPFTVDTPSGDRKSDANLATQKLSFSNVAPLTTICSRAPSIPYSIALNEFAGPAATYDLLFAKSEFTIDRGSLDLRKKQTEFQVERQTVEKDNVVLDVLPGHYYYQLVSRERLVKGILERASDVYQVELRTDCESMNDLLASSDGRRIIWGTK